MKYNHNPPLTSGVYTVSVVDLRWIVKLSTWICQIYILKWQTSKVWFYTFDPYR